jgi:hypothetical protein
MSADQNLNETLIEDWWRRWLWSWLSHFPCAAHQKTAFPAWCRRTTAPPLGGSDLFDKGCH